MRYRKYEPPFVNEQFKFRAALFKSFHDFSLADFKDSLAYQETALSALQVVIQYAEKKEKPFFLALEHLLTAMSYLFQYFEQLLSANPEATAKRAAAHAHAKLALGQLDKWDADRPSVIGLRTIAKQLATIEEIGGVEALVTEIKKIALPVLYTTDSWNDIMRGDTNKEDSEDSTPETPVISVLFFFDKELWANPQVIKPNHLYTLSGHIKVNFWPDGYSTLHLMAVTTTNDSWYTLSLPSLPYSDKPEIPIHGHITIHAPQNLLDPPIAIRLFAYFSGTGRDNLNPAVIGYDQLILRVVDMTSFPFPTGYNSLNKKTFEITSQIMQELPAIDREELDNFLILLSAILNYQGYCYQYGIYKHRADVTEAEFRDNLIAHLSARDNLAEAVVKEGAIAGGKVEINFRGIVAELKVEKTVADRVKVMEAHEKQPIAYAAATGARLSILCILDLTDKKNAPAPANLNVFLRKPPVHGFPPDDSPSRVVVIFIDGNLPNPSAYK